MQRAVDRSVDRNGISGIQTNIYRTVNLYISYTDQYLQIHSVVNIGLSPDIQYK